MRVQIRLKIAGPFFALCTLVVAFAGAGFAAQNIQPLDVKLGLWESTTVRESSGFPPIPPEALARLTPEQRAKIEAAAKASASRGPKTETRKSCLTKEKLNKALTFGQSNNDNCKATVVTSTRTKEEIHFECAGEGMKGAGDMHIEAINSENVKGSIQMNAAGGGNTMKTSVNFTAKWLGPSCADVKD